MVCALNLIQRPAASSPTSHSEMWEYDAGMAGELVRYQECGHLHLVTFSCYRRLPHLSNAASMELFERSLETPRVRYDFLLLCAQY